MNEFTNYNIKNNKSKIKIFKIMKQIKKFVHFYNNNFIS